MTATTTSESDVQPTAGTVAALREVLDGRWPQVRAAVRERIETALHPPTADLSSEAHREQVLGQLHELAASGMQRLGFETRWGGTDDIGGSVTSFSMLGFSDLSLLVKAGVQWGLFGGAIQALGTEQHHERYLRPAMDLDLLGCFAMTETGHGSDVQSIRTTATYDVGTGELVVHTPDREARKDYIGNAARDGRLAVVFAQLATGGEGHGVHAVLVPIRDENGDPAPGVTIEDCGRKAGLNGVDNGRLTFDSVRVPREALLDRYGSVAEDGTYSSPIENDSRRFFTMLGTLVRGRVSIAGGGITATELALTIALRYAERRRQFARPGSDEEVVLLDYLAHQRRLLPALATTYALHLAQDELVGLLHDVQSDPEPDDARQRELEGHAAGLKAAATWHATATIQTCREACGGAGYLWENQLPALKADTDVFTTFEGDNTVLLQLLAKTLLTRYRDHFGDLDTLGTVRFVADQVVEAVIERTSARAVLQRLASARRGPDSDLRDRAWHVQLFEDRERHVLETLARRLRAAAGEDGDPFEAFNAAQDHLLRAARVHVDRLVLDAFVSAVDRCEDPRAAALLDQVCDLHVLSTIEQDLDWFTGHGRLTPARAKAVTRAVNDLCRELRPHASTLVDALAVPDAAVTAAFLRD